MTYKNLVESDFKFLVEARDEAVTVYESLFQDFDFHNLDNAMRRVMILIGPLETHSYYILILSSVHKNQILSIPFPLQDQDL